MKSRRAPIAILATLALAVAACGGASSSGDEARSRDREEPTAWRQVLDGITDDGTVPKETALQAFSLALGPLPGVEVPGGEVGTITSATGAVRWLSRYYDELPAEQQQAAARLAPELAELPGPGGPGAHLAGPPPGQDSPGAEKYRAEVDALVAEIGPQIGTGPLPYKVQIVLEPKSDGVAAMRAGGRDPCTLRIYPEGASLTGANLHAVLAHEVFHCYENFVLNTFVAAGTAPWLVEGMAEWVGASLAPTSALASESWPNYLLDPEKILYSRAYDAIGFYSHLEYMGLDVWSLLVPMLLAGDSGGNTGALDVAIDPGGPIVDDWPSGYVRNSGLGKHWATDGPGITADKPQLQTAVVDNQGRFGPTLPAAKNIVGKVDLQADVLTFGELTASGHFRLPDDSEPSFAELLQAPLCTLPEGCSCPEGSAAAGMQFRQTKKGITLVALSGGLSGADVVMNGSSLDQFCKQEPDDTSPPAAASGLDQCLVGTWVSTAIKPAVGGLAGAAEVTYEGGAGAVFTVKRSGAASIDFEPTGLVEGTLVANGEVLGTTQLAFTGQVTGKMSTSGNEVFSLGIESNTWAYEGVAETDFGPFPFSGNVTPQAAVGSFEATYTCSPTTFDFTITGEQASTGSIWARQM